MLVQADLQVMKSCRWLISGLTAILLFGGCSSNMRVDTSAMELEFQSAEPLMQKSALRAIEAIKSAENPAALKELQTLFRNRKLTPEQRGSIKRVVAQLQRIVPKTPVERVTDAPLLAAHP